MFNSLLFLALSWFLSANAFAANGSDRLSKAIDKYSHSKFIKMTVNKTVKQAVLEKVKISSGELSIGQGGKLRFEIQQPDHSLIILDSKNIWSIEYLPADFGGGLNILRGSADSKKQPVVATLFGSKKILKSYKVKSIAIVGDVEELQLDAKSKAEDVMQLKIWVNKKSNEIQKVSWFDNLKNENVLEFSKTQFLDKGDENLFQFTPPKGAKVIQE